MTRRILFTALAVATIGLAFATGAASAKEKGKPAPLPGVDAGYSIVKPLPEPDETTDTENSDRHFKIGNTEVRIGGYVRVDVGIGSMPRPKH